MYIIMWFAVCFSVSPLNHSYIICHSDSSGTIMVVVAVILMVALVVIRALELKSQSGIIPFMFLH